MLSRRSRKRWPRGVDVRDGHGRGPRRNRTRGASATGVDGVFAAYLFRNVTERRPGAGRRRRPVCRPAGRSSCRSTRSPARRSAAAVWTLVCWAGRHPAEPGSPRADPALPLPVAQRARLRLRAAVRRPAARGRLRRRRASGPSRAGSAASCTPSARSRRDPRDPPPAVTPDRVSRAGRRVVTRARCGTRPPAAGGRAPDRGTTWSSSAAASRASRRRPALAERGVAVALVEPEEQLGGRVRAWPVGRRTAADDEPRLPRLLPPVLQPARLLRRTDPTLRAPRPRRGLPAGAGRRAAGLLRPASRARRRSTWPPSWPASPTFTLADLRQVDIGAAIELLDVDFPATFGALRRRERRRRSSTGCASPTHARHLALEVFARSFFADPEDFAAGELVAMFHTYFLGSSEGLLFDVPDDDYDTALWAPLGRYLRGLGVRVRTGTSAALDLSEPGGRRRVALATRRGAGRRRGRPRHRTRRHRAGSLRGGRGSATPAGASGSPRPRSRRRSRSGGSGSTGPSTPGGRRSSARAASGRWTTSRVLERFEAGARALGRGARRLGGRAARVRAGGRAGRRRAAPGAAAARARPGLPRAGRRRRRRRGVARPRRTARWSAPSRGGAADRADARPPSRAGRRRGPLRPAGRADGAGGDDRLPRGEPAARPPRRPRARPLERARTRPQPARPPLHRLLARVS